MGCEVQSCRLVKSHLSRRGDQPGMVVVAKGRLLPFHHRLDSVIEGPFPPKCCRCQLRTEEQAAAEMDLVRQELWMMLGQEWEGRYTMR